MTLVEETQPVDCSRSHEIMSNVVEAASPYLYPCVIQYSLIATGTLLVNQSFAEFISSLILISYRIEEISVKLHKYSDKSIVKTLFVIEHFGSCIKGASSY